MQIDNIYLIFHFKKFEFHCHLLMSSILSKINFHQSAFLTHLLLLAGYMEHTKADKIVIDDEGTPENLLGL